MDKPVEMIFSAMTKDNEERDIMGEILTDETTGIMDGIAELACFLQSPRPDQASGAGRTSRRQWCSAHRKPPKKKSTHYLPLGTFKELEKTKKRLRKIVPEQLRTKISKSLLVDLSLRLALEDFHARGEESDLVRQIIREKDRS